ncbi:hypothetical protein C2G38_2112939 [Gigaspora rosea]|uniref:Uncharacterized protein n=1 Tax=Gigaspora rosea TaxID=44941 RepID=A0A397UDM4_9GLOM|nr:hypothetical protein C2G38_2112939 [Gigaspora rosea]
MQIQFDVEFVRISKSINFFLISNSITIIFTYSYTHIRLINYIYLLCLINYSHLCLYS